MHQYPRLNAKSLVIKRCERDFLWSYSEIFPIKLKNDWCCEGHVFHLFSNPTMSESVYDSPALYNLFLLNYFLSFSWWWCNKTLCMKGTTIKRGRKKKSICDVKKVPKYWEAFLKLLLKCYFWICDTVLHLCFVFLKVSSFLS